MLASTCRFLFHEWEAVNDDPMKLIWQTNNPEHLSQLVRLEKLGGKGFGCAKLLNARASKPSETVMLVVPPALAILKTAKGSNDRVLIVTFHLAMLHEVQHAPLIPLVPPTTAQLLCALVCCTGRDVRAMHEPREEGLPARVSGLLPGEGAAVERLCGVRGDELAAPQEARALPLAQPDPAGGPRLRDATNPAWAEEAQEEGGAAQSRSSRESPAVSESGELPASQGSASITSIAILGEVEASDAPGEVAASAEQQPRGLPEFLGRRRRGLERCGVLPIAAPPCDEFAEVFTRDKEPPPGFRLTLRYSAQAAPASEALVVAASGSDGGGEASDLRRRIDYLSKKAAKERGGLESVIRSLKNASKQGSRELYKSLNKMDANVDFLLREGKRVASNCKYWRRTAKELEIELAATKKKMREMREENDSNERRAREAEMAAQRKDMLIDKNETRRVAAEQAYRGVASDLRRSKLVATQALHAVDRSRIEMDELINEVRPQTYNKGTQASAPKCTSRATQVRPHQLPSSPEDEESDHMDEVLEERDTLAKLTADLANELSLSRLQIQKLTESAAVTAPEPARRPKYIELELVPSERSQRRAVQNDVEYLTELFKQRPWRAPDVARALERADLIGKVCETKQVRLPA